MKMRNEKKNGRWKTIKTWKKHEMNLMCICLKIQIFTVAAEA